MSSLLDKKTLWYEREMQTKYIMKSNVYLNAAKSRFLSSHDRKSKFVK